MEFNDEDEGHNSNDDEDPTWTLEEIDREYQKLKNEDDSEKTHDNPRLTNNIVLSLCYTEWWPELFNIKTNLKATYKMVNNNKCDNPYNWSSSFTIFFRLDLKGKNVREEPKGIVFLSKLILLFEFCHLCLFRNPKVAVTKTGTMLSIVTECSKCGETWKSQPDLMGRFPAGNLLLSFAVLCAGASIRKVLLVFRLVGFS